MQSFNEYALGFQDAAQQQRLEAGPASKIQLQKPLEANVSAECGEPYNLIQTTAHFLENRLLLLLLTLSSSTSLYVLRRETRTNLEG